MAQKEEECNEMPEAQCEDRITRRRSTLNDPLAPSEGGDDGEGWCCGKRSGKAAITRKVAEK